MCRLKSNFTGGGRGCFVFSAFLRESPEQWEVIITFWTLFKNAKRKKKCVSTPYEPRYFTTILMHNNSKIFNKDNQLGRAKIVGARSSRYSWLPLAGPFVEVETRVSQGWSNYILQAQARPGLDISTS